MSEHCDALVIGAGAGGLFAAARLAHRGYRTLVVERLDRVGGRASTYEIDGFKVNNGAIVIEVGGITEETFAEVGAKFDVRQPHPPLLYRIKNKDIDATGGGWGKLLQGLTRQGAKLVGGIGAARRDEGLPPDDQLTTDQWLSKYTKNDTVHGMFRNMCGSIFAVGSEELPARVFLTYFTRKSAFKKFGFCPEGTIGVWRALAESITANGGEIWLDSEVTALSVENGRVTGATVRRGDETVDIRADVVVSDVGPLATLGLVGEDNLPADYVATVKQRSKPCAMISVNFASQEPLIKAPGMLSFGRTRRLCYVANFTATCPEMAPPGWHLYVGTGVPKPSVGEFDEQAETELVLADLREQIPGFDKARVLDIAVTKDEWPPQRIVAGFDLPHTTPIANLWHVGDAVKDYANGGTTACAEVAKTVVEEIAMSSAPRGGLQDLSPPRGAAMKGITPCIWFDDQGEEAATFWTSIFKDSKINAVTHYPSDAPSKQAGEVLTVEFEIAGQPFTALNGGPEFKPNEAISFQVNCENQDEIDHYWDALTADGGEEGPCGWVKDKYGVSWQIVPVEFIDMWNNPDQKKVAAAFGAMMQMKKLDIAELKRAYDSAGSSE